MLDVIIGYFLVFLIGVIILYGFFTLLKWVYVLIFEVRRPETTKQEKGRQTTLDNFIKIKQKEKISRVV